LTLLRPDRPAIEPPDLNAIYRAHAKTVARWAALLGGPDIDVEDVVHEVFLVAQRRLPAFRGDGKVTTWLYRATDRVVRHERRRLALRRRRMSQLDPDGQRAAEDGTLARNEARRTIYRVLETMSDRYRQVFVLFEIDELSGDAIAELLAARVDTVWVWVHRARAQFFRGLQELKRQEEAPADGATSTSVVRLVGRS
jgi:RNA polymerase sigma-70 factor (ECF subfamily)